MGSAASRIACFASAIAAAAAVFLSCGLSRAAELSLTNSLAVLTNRTNELGARKQAIDALLDVTTEARDSLTPLLQIARDKGEPLEIRLRALGAARQIGLESEEQAAAVWSLYGDPTEESDVRRAVLLDFGQDKRFAPVVLPVLLDVLQDRKQPVVLRRLTAFVLRNSDTTGVVEGFGRLLSNPGEDPELRSTAMAYFQQPSANAAAALAALTGLATNAQEAVKLRAEAITTLRGMGSAAEPAVPALLNLVRDDQAPLALRLAAANALKQTGAPDEQGLAGMLSVLADNQENTGLRHALIPLLQSNEKFLQAHAADLLAMLRDPREDRAVREFAAEFLARTPAAVSEALPQWIGLLQDKKADPVLRRSAALGLQTMGEDAAPAAQVVLAVLNDPAEDPDTKRAAAPVVGRIAQTLLTRPDQLDRQDLNTKLARLAALQAALDQSGLGANATEKARRDVQRVREVLLGEKHGRRWERMLDWADQHRLFRRVWFWVGLGVFGGAVLLSLFWGFLTLVRPRAVERISQRWERYDIHLPAWLGGGKMGLRHLALVAPWRKHRRVVDAWLDGLAPSVLAALRPAEQRVFIPTPVVIGDKEIDAPGSAQMQWLFSRSTVRLVVHGAKGSGKSEWAHYLARLCLAAKAGERLRPRLVFPIVFTPAEMAGTAGVTKSFATLLHTRLLGLFSGAQPLPPDRLRQLVRQHRLLIIADGFSEWDEAGRLLLTDFVRAWKPPLLVLTTRQKHDLTLERTEIMELLPLEGASLSGFLEHYWREVGKSSLFTDQDGLESSRVLAQLTGGRPLTPRVARFYAEYCVVEKETNLALKRPPDLGAATAQFLRRKNSLVKGKRLGDQTVYRVAEELAWASVKPNYQVEPVRRYELPENLATEENAAAKIEYLEQRLTVLRPIGKNGHWLAFEPELLALYLAAHRLVTANGSREDAWWRFFKDLDSRPAGQTREFLQAVADCCLPRFTATDETARLPDLVSQELTRRLGDTRGQQQMRHQSRVQSLLKSLLLPDPGERDALIRQLVELGPEGAAAVGPLAATLRNQREDMEVRQSALVALAALGTLAQPAVSALLELAEDKQEQSFVRLKALEIVLAIEPRLTDVSPRFAAWFADPAEPGFFRMKLAELLNGLPEWSAEATAILESIRQQDPDTEIRAQAQRLLGTEPAKAGR